MTGDNGTKLSLIRPSEAPAATIATPARQTEDLKASVAPRTILAEIRSLYASFNLGDPCIVVASSPHLVLLAGALAAGVRQFWRGSHDEWRAKIRRWRESEASEAEGDRKLPALVRAATIGLDRSSSMANRNETAVVYPYHWDKADQAVWQVTRRGMCGREHQGAPLMSPSRESRRGARAPPYIAFLHEQLRREILRLSHQERDRSPPPPASLPTSTEAAWADYDDLSRILFDSEGRFGLRLLRMAPYMLEFGPFDQARGFSASDAKTEARDFLGQEREDGREHVSIGAATMLHADFCMISGPPERLSVDALGRAHAAAGPYCRWRNGLALYAIHGVAVDGRVVEHPGTLTVAEIDAQANAEVARVLIDLYGPARYLRNTGAAIIDHDERWGTLHRREPPHGGEPMLLVEVVNRTPEPDGSFRHYFLRVHPELRPLLQADDLGEPQAMTARNAVASTFGLRGEDYCCLVES